MTGGVSSADANDSPSSGCRVPARRGCVAHARQQVIAAGDQLLEHARRPVEELLDDDDLVAFDDHEPGSRRPRGEHVGEAHSSKLPGAARARSLPDLQP